MCKCSNCGKEKMLVLSSLYAGEICYDCYKEVIERLECTKTEKFKTFDYNGIFDSHGVKAIKHFTDKLKAQFRFASIHDNVMCLKYKLRYRGQSCIGIIVISNDQNYVNCIIENTLTHKKYYHKTVRRTAVA